MANDVEGVRAADAGKRPEGVFASDAGGTLPASDFPAVSASGGVFTVRGLSFAYAARTNGEAPRIVFDGLDLSVREGVITTLIGANGSGKSTLFGLLTKNLVPQKGSVFLRGGDVTALRLSDFARLVAIVHQRNVAPPDLAVEKLVGYGRFPHRKRGRAAATEDDERMVAWALEVTGLLPFAKRPVSALSGGQMQRAWVAMALAQGTEVLILDEPTTYLDIRYQLELLELLHRLNRQMGLTVVMVLHDINQAIQFSDELVALADGRIVAQGPPRDVVTSQLLFRVYGVALEVTSVHDRPYVLTAAPPETGAACGGGGMSADRRASGFGDAGREADASADDGREGRGGSPPPLEEEPSDATKEDDAMDISREKTPAAASVGGGRRRFRGAWTAVGLIAFGLALVGVALPLVPTTPFALAAAFCFARGSERLNVWFRSTRLYKTVLEGYVTKRAMTWRAKLSIIVPVTVLLAIGFVLMADVPAGRVVLAVVWLGHLVYFGAIVKTDRASA